MRPEVSYEWEEPPADDVRALPLPAVVREVLRGLTWPQEPPRSRRGSGRSRLWEGEGLTGPEALSRFGERLPAVGPAHLVASDGTPLDQTWWCEEFAAGRIGLRLQAPRPACGAHDQAEDPLPTTSIRWSRWDGQALPPPETARRPHKGDSTDLIVRGVRVHLRVSWPGATKLLWLDPSGHSVRRVEVHSAEPPLPALERLVRDTDLLPGR